MQVLLLLHRWTGGIAGLLLAVIGLSGTLLLWEDSWIGLPGAHDPVRHDAAEMGRAMTAVMAAGEAAPLARVTLADETIGLHQAVYRDGSGAYLGQDGSVVDQWSSPFGRAELWLFDLHHHLFIREDGAYVTGVLGLLLIGFVVTGSILWWRTRKTFRLRLWPPRMSRPAIIWHHRDLGIIAAPLLLVMALTGALMVFKPLSAAVLAPFAQHDETPLPRYQATSTAGPETDWRLLIETAQAAFPGALPRRFQFPAKSGEPLVLRMKQTAEWTPNGRTYVYFDPATATILGVNDPLQGDVASRIEEKYYPVHAGRVGGVVWRIMLTLTGLALVLLGTLACWTFWFRSPRQVPRQSSSHVPTATRNASSAHSSVLLDSGG